MIEKIKCIDIDKTFDKEGKSFRVLKNINLSVKAGENVCILGPSGCGKSTLLRLIGGFDKPEGGKVLIDGRELERPSADSILIFQDFNQLLPWKTVFENVMYPLKVCKKFYTSEERKEIALSSLGMVGLEDSLMSYPHQLSGGMKQKAALARAIAMKPSIMLMDEPFGSLDALTRHNMQLLLENLWRNAGMTIVFVTHDVEESIILGDRIVVMGKEPGQILRIVPNMLERPRDIGSQGFSGLYKEVYSLLES